MVMVPAATRLERVLLRVCVLPQESGWRAYAAQKQTAAGWGWA